MKANKTKLVHVILIIYKDTCPSITLNCLRISQIAEAKYIGLHVDRRVNWKKHIFIKRK